MRASASRRRSCSAIRRCSTLSFVFSLCCCICRLRASLFFLFISLHCSCTSHVGTTSRATRVVFDVLFHPCNTLKDTRRGTASAALRSSVMARKASLSAWPAGAPSSRLDEICCLIRTRLMCRSIAKSKLVVSCERSTRFRQAMQAWYRRPSLSRSCFRRHCCTPLSRTRFFREPAAAALPPTSSAWDWSLPASWMASTWPSARAASGFGRPEAACDVTGPKRN